MKKKYFGLIMAGLLVLTGCGKEKEVKGINDYETVCGNNNYQIIDRMERYVNDSYITNSKACVLDNGEIVKKNTPTISDIVSLAKKIDVNKLQDGVNSLSKAVGLFSDLFTGNNDNNNDSYKPRAIYQRFDD